MKVKTAEATKLQLDWGLGLAIGYTQLTLQVAGKVYGTAPDGGREQISHTDPAVCMGLIKEHDIGLRKEKFWWDAGLNITVGMSHQQMGDTPEQAVARCVIAMKLGDEFEVPDELGVMG